MGRRERSVETNSMASSELKLDEVSYISLYLHDLAYADKQTFEKLRYDYIEAIRKLRNK